MRKGLVLLLLLAMAAWMSGCGGGGDKTTTVKTPGGDAMVTKKDDGTVQYEASDGEGGTVKIEAGSSKIPDGFPKDMPIPDGAKIVSSVKTTMDEGDAFMVIFESGEESEKLADYYREVMKKLGMKTSEASGENGITLIGEGGNTNLIVSLVPNPNEAGKLIGTVTYTPDLL